MLIVWFHATLDSIRIEFENALPKIKYSLIFISQRISNHIELPALATSEPNTPLLSALI